MLQRLLLKEGLKSVKKSAKAGTGATQLFIPLPPATSKKTVAHVLVHWSIAQPGIVMYEVGLPRSSYLSQ